MSPVYEYRCRMCDWRRTRRAPLYTDAIACESCGETAYRNPVNRFNYNVGIYTGELQPGHDDIRDQLLGYAEEATKAVESEKENGWDAWRDLKS